MMSVLRMSKLVLPSMKEKKWGRIINISSVSVKTPVNNLFLSNSIRLGVLGWAKALSDEVGKDGITVNTVSPGFIDTDMTQTLTDEQKEGIFSQVPANRLGKPEEIASTVAFLASDAAAYVTGETIHVNGGMYMV